MSVRMGVGGPAGSMEGGEGPRRGQSMPHEN